jgi:hypothetical protein
MKINLLTDLDCEGCGEGVNVLADDVEPIIPLLCGACLAMLLEAEAEGLAEAA